MVLQQEFLIPGPLHNLGAALEIGGFSLGRWVAQGGFAGDGVVPKHLQMECPGCESYDCQVKPAHFSQEVCRENDM